MSRDRWELSISFSYGDDVTEPTPDEKRAADLLELILNDRLDDLIAWAKQEMATLSGAVLVRVKGSA